jgi:hypothetical protein
MRKTHSGFLGQSSDEDVPNSSPNASREKRELNKDALLETRGGGWSWGTTIMQWSSWMN